MWEAFPPLVAWRATLRRPRTVATLAAVPLAWDLIKRVLASVPGVYFARWDFSIGFDYTWPTGSARFVFPPALPSAEHLGVAISPAQSASPTLLHLAGMLLVLLADSLVKAGYLNLLNGVLHGIDPSWKGLLRGVRRFGVRLFLIALIWMGYFSAASWLASKGVLPDLAVVGLHLLVISVLLTAEFVTVVEDVWPPQAIIGAPLIFWGTMSSVLAVGALSGIASALITGITSLAHLNILAVLSPVYAVVGTWVAASALQALQTGISTRSEYEGFSWVCPGCRVNNQPGAAECVACGYKERPPRPAPEGGGAD